MRRRDRSWRASLSLGARMVALFSGLVAAIGVFMLAFFPARMAEQAQASTEARATSIAQVMSTALGPAIEFEDADNAASILGWLANTADAQFGVLRYGGGLQLAAWRPDAIPGGQDWPAAGTIAFGPDCLVVTMPVRGRGGAHGELHLGFSLHRLVAERNAIRGTVAIATATVFVIGVLATMLLAALVVRPIRRLTQTALRISRGELPPELPAVTGGSELARMADALRAMLERVNEVGQQELMRASRHAGMAEVATGVLHNVGNVLTAVNVCVELMRERISAMPIDRLGRLHELLSASSSLDGERLGAAVRYVEVVRDALDRGRAETLRDVATLGNNVEHMKRVVAMQNAYARHGGVVEPTRIAALIDEAIEIGCPPARRGDIEIAIDAALDSVLVDRHRVLQIVVNLMTNACDAVRAGRGHRRIEVRAELAETDLRIRVEDTGVGIAADQIDRIFNAGFTTKPTGHGYGLHSSALAARQLEGSLVVQSAGLGRGASFLLTVPTGERTKVHDHDH
jgi:signal transduction histidine kinase